MTKPATLNCRDVPCPNYLIEGVGPENTLEMVALRSGWTRLQIAGGWRCPSCWHKLEASAQYEGAAVTAMFVDSLPADSIGALRNPTAHTISEPVVPLLSGGGGDYGGAGASGTYSVEDAGDGLPFTHTGPEPEPSTAPAPSYDAPSPEPAPATSYDAPEPPAPSPSDS